MGGGWCHVAALSMVCMEVIRGSGCGNGCNTILGTGIMSLTQISNSDKT